TSNIQPPEKLQGPSSKRDFSANPEGIASVSPGLDRRGKGPIQPWVNRPPTLKELQRSGMNGSPLEFHLALAPATPHSNRMSTKQIVQDLLQRLPEDVSLHDVAQEFEFIAAVRQGLTEIERGERIPIEEIERELPSWVIK